MAEPAAAAEQLRAASRVGDAVLAMIKLAAVKPAGFSPFQASRGFTASRRVATMAAKRVLVPIGRGSEEMEAVRHPIGRRGSARRRWRCPRHRLRRFRQGRSTLLAAQAHFVAFHMLNLPPLQVITIDVLRRAGAEVRRAKCRSLLA